MTTRSETAIKQWQIKGVLTPEEHQQLSVEFGDDLPEIGSEYSELLVAFILRNDDKHLQ